MTRLQPEQPKYIIRCSYHTRYDEAYLDAPLSGEWTKPILEDEDVSQYSSLQDLAAHLVTRAPALLKEVYEMWEGALPSIADVHVHCQYGWLQLNWKTGSKLSHFCPMREYTKPEDDTSDFHQQRTGGLRFNFKNSNVVYVCWDPDCISYVNRQWWKYDECVVCKTIFRP